MTCLDEQTAAAFIDGSLPEKTAAEVEEHVDGCSDCRRLLASLAVALGPSVRDERPLRAESLSVGDRVARYRIEERLGSGAMGVVYRAVDPDLGRDVALKLVRPARPTAGSDEQADARLLREARALARLSHPNVVPVFDVGTYGGAVFFAMELLGGGTLGAWLAREEHDWRTILDRFLAAGRGLQAAHEAGLVHRDFKPENVLLAAGDRVCVTDFGLVRATGPHAGELGLDDAPPPTDFSAPDTVHQPLVTGEGYILGTPAFMAPEQLAGEAATAQSDQFSFCVALYMALYGEPPFAGTTLAELRAALARNAVAEPATRALAPSALRPVLLCGLRLDPADRFPSMAELSTALEEAMQAGPRVTRSGALAALAFVALSLVLVGGALLASRRSTVDPCASAGAPIGEVWSRATRDAMERSFRDSGARRAEVVAGRVAEQLDAYASDWQTMAKASCQATYVQHTQAAPTFTLREQCLDQELVDVRPIVDALVHADAAIVPSASALLASLPSVTSCTDTSTAAARMKPPDPTKATEVAALQRQLAQTRALTLVGRGHNAVSAAESTVEEARAVGYAPLVAEALLTLGLVETGTAMDSRGVRTLLEAVDVAEASRNDAVAALGWTSLVRAHLLMDSDGVSAERAFSRATAAVQRLDGASSARERLMDSQAYLELCTGHFAEAIVHFDMYIAALEQRFGADDLLLVRPLDDLGRALRSTRDYARALAVNERQLAIATAYLGPETTRTARPATDYGTDLMLLGRYAEAESALEGARAVYERTLGTEHTAEVYTLLALGELYDRTGRLDQGLASVQRGAAIEEKTFGPEHSAVAFAQSALAEAYLRRNRYADALTAATRSLRIWSTLGETGSFERARAEALRAAAALGLSHPRGR